MSKSHPPAGRKPGERPALAGRPPTRRSAVTNGTRLLSDGDNAGPWARRVGDLIALHEDDLGDPATLSEAQRQLVRRCAVLEAQLEQMEGRMSRGEDVSLDLYQRSTNTLGRQLERLGLRRADRTKTIEADRLSDHFSRPPGSPQLCGHPAKA